MDNNNTLGQYIVGAYATSPNLFTWDKESELNYFNRLKKLTSIRGLELPFWGESLHPFDDQWLLKNLDPHWQNVLTCVPGTMRYLERDPYFGLASKNAKSRSDAIKFYLIAYKCVKDLKNQFGQESVIAIYIASSPFINHKQIFADKECFVSSLIELASWDWGNTKLLIEHCDAYNSNNPKPKKGFLSLSDEIYAVRRTNQECGSDFGIVINWGRSVIEHRNVEGPLKHIKNTVQHSVLCGLMFSGTASNNNNLYGAWSDLHMPPANYSDFQYFEKESLMSFENIKNTLAACDFNALDCLGIKLLAKPSNSTIEKRISINRNTMILLDQTINEINRA
tara:strand:+ start:21257 stop:22267 length:1011 start_codon:yes stop_codon:yes gene_type:complete